MGKWFTATLLGAALALVPAAVRAQSPQPVPDSTRSPFLRQGIPGLSEPSPNPARSETTIDYSLGEISGPPPTLRVFDFLGNEVITLQLSRRDGSVLLKVSTLKPGIYFYSLETEGKILATKRLVVTR